MSVIRAVIPLSPHLEKVWQKMQELKAHPRFEEALDRLDPRFQEAYVNLMYVPRIWLNDGREFQVKAAMEAIKKALNELEP